MAARKRTWTPDLVRERIQTSMLINRLHDHAFAKVEMTATQLRAAEVLLKKAIPDLSSVEYTGEMTVNDARELSREILERIATGGGAGTTEAAGCTDVPVGVH